MHDHPIQRERLEGDLGRGDLAGAARLELVSGVAQLRPEDAMFEAMLQRLASPTRRPGSASGHDRAASGWCGGSWRSPTSTRGAGGRVTSRSGPSPCVANITSPRPPSGATRSTLRLFSEYLTDARYGWVAACEEAFGAGAHPVPICHEWNTIAHLSDYEGNPEARPFTREELQRFLDYADDQVERAVASGARARWPPTGTPPCSRSSTAGGCAAPRRPSSISSTGAPTRPRPSSPASACSTSVTARPSRGQPPRRRNVLSVMDWAVDAVADYVDNVRPRFGCADHPRPVGDRTRREDQAGARSTPASSPTATHSGCAPS